LPLAVVSLVIGVFVLVVFISALETSRRDQAPKPVSLGFDSRDPEVTCRWLIREAIPIKESKKAADHERINNPLRKDSYNAYMVNQQKWAQFLKGLSGKKITCPGQIQWITERDVKFACFVEGISENDIIVKIEFDPYPREYEAELREMELIHHRGSRDHCNGLLVIGRDISLEAARTLDRKMWIDIEGIVEKVASRIGSYPDIRLYVRTTGVLFPVANRLESTHELPTVYSSQGKYSQAEQLEKKVLDVRRPVLGEAHPDMLRAMADLGEASLYLRRWARAEELRSKVLGIGPKVLGEDDSLVPITMGYLAEILRAKGNVGQAGALYTKSLEGLSRTLGEETGATLGTMVNLSWIYIEEGKNGDSGDNAPKGPGRLSTFSK
jgi:hypothetical protein